MEYVLAWERPRRRTRGLLQRLSQVRAGAGATLVKVPEIFQVETPHGPGGLASVLNVMTEAGLVLEHVSTVRRDQDRTLREITVEIDEAPTDQRLPGPLDVKVHERVSRAVQTAALAQESLAADLRDAPQLPGVPDFQSETT